MSGFLSFQETLIPIFGWTVLVIIALAALLWLVRTSMVLVTGEYKLKVNETLGLPKGTIRSFIVITFTAIMFLVFFGDVGNIVPPEDRKWFLAAYASVISFYFGTKYLPQSLGRTGLSISSITPEVANPGNANVSFIITGSGFNDPSEVAFSRGGVPIVVSSSLKQSSDESIEAVFSIPAAAATGSYDISVELANGSRIVRKSALQIQA